MGCPLGGESAPDRPPLVITRWMGVFFLSLFFLMWAVVMDSTSECVQVLWQRTCGSLARCEQQLGIKWGFKNMLWGGKKKLKQEERMLFQRKAPLSLNVCAGFKMHSRHRWLCAGFPLCLLQPGQQVAAPCAHITQPGH